MPELKSAIEPSSWEYSGDEFEESEGLGGGAMNFISTGGSEPGEFMSEATARR